MRYRSILAAAVLLACGEPEPAPSTAAAPSDASSAPEDTLAAPEGPWTVRAIRSCSIWSGSILLGTSRELFACNGAVFDAQSSELIRPAEQTYPEQELHHHGAHSAWHEPNAGTVTIRTREGARVHRVEPLVSAGAFSPDGTRLAMATPDTLQILDVASGDIAEPAEARRCANAERVGFDTQGRVQCATPTTPAELITLGEPEPVPLPGTYAVHWLPGGRGMVTLDEDTVTWRDERGTPRASRRAPTDARLLALAEDGSALVSTPVSAPVENAPPGRTERWWRDGDRIRTEVVYPHGASRGVFVGDGEIALAVFEDVIWLHRGPVRELDALPAPTPPAGHASYAADGALFVGPRGSFRRGPQDVAEFGPTRGDGAFIRVTHGDAAELARFSNLAAWGGAAMGRYIDPGSQRWAKAWRGTDGSRMMRGHTFIGGCERAHVHVMVRERGNVLERWTAVGGPSTAPPSFGSIPSDAQEVSDGLRDGYAGDPSTGPQ